jgi:membrane protease YdiL (CAAX protease family)
MHYCPVRLRLSLGLTLGAMVSANILAHRVPSGADVAVGVGLTGGLAVIARAAGLTADDLGLGRRTLPAGLRWGGAAAAVVAAGYGVAALLPMVRDAAPESSTSWSATMVKVLVLIPLTTVIPEEFAFRGVLWGLLRRDAGRAWATAVSSTVFGLWHVQSALGGGSANESVAAVVGDGSAGVALRVIGTVLFTGLAGVLFCELRARSDSLVAPMLLHWAVNGFGEIFVAAA